MDVPQSFELQPQCDDPDLGVRMRHALMAELQTADRVSRLQSHRLNIIVAVANINSLTTVILSHVLLSW